MIILKYLGDNIGDGEVSGKITHNNEYYVLDFISSSSSHTKAVLLDDNGLLYNTREDVVENTAVWELVSASETGCVSLT